MSDSLKRPNHHVYLLSFWQSKRQQAGEPAIWRFSLADPHSGKRQGFANLDDLFHFLWQQTKPTQDLPGRSR